MSVSSNSTTVPSQTLQSLSQQIRQDFSALGSALQAGDLSSAQQAYDSLLQLQNPGGQSSGSTSCSFSRSNDKR